MFTRVTSFFKKKKPLLNKVPQPVMVVEHPVQKNNAPIKRVLSELSLKLHDPAYFYGFGNRLKEGIRVARIDGLDLVIKDTRGDSDQGHNYQQLRQAFLKHQTLVREGKIVPKNYSLRSIKVHGLVNGRYLVMQKKNARDITVMDLDKKAPELQAAYKELVSHMEIAREGILSHKPQYSHSMYVETIKNGKKHYLFYLPYDFY